jgi:hypothetical protein
MKQQSSRLSAEAMYGLDGLDALVALVALDGFFQSSRLAGSVLSFSGQWPVVIGTQQSAKSEPGAARRKLQILPLRPTQGRDDNPQGGKEARNASRVTSCFPLVPASLPR